MVYRLKPRKATRVTRRTSSPASRRPPSQQSGGSSRLWLLLGLVAAGLVLVLGVFGGQGGWFGQSSGAPAAGNGPRIAWDETVYDFGPVPFNKQVEHSFVYRNTGDAPLTILERPTVETIVGC